MHCVPAVEVFGAEKIWSVNQAKVEEALMSYCGVTSLNPYRRMNIQVILFADSKGPL